MNFIQLKYFAEVARHRNFTRASAALRIAQPAVTRQIRLLETELGLALLTRHARGVALTPAGAVLYERCGPLLLAMEQTRSEMRNLTDVPSGNLRIGCTPALTRPLMIQPLYKFLTRFPKVSVQLQEGVSDQLCGAVLSEHLDGAVISSKPAEPYLQVTPLFSEKIWLFGPGTDKKLKGSVKLDVISTLPMLLARRSQTTREIIEHRMAKAGLDFKVLVESDSVQVIQGLILQGLGYTVAPYSAYASCLKDRSIRGAWIEDFSIERSFVRRNDRPVTRAMHEFSKMLQDASTHSMWGRGEASKRKP